MEEGLEEDDVSVDDDPLSNRVHIRLKFWFGEEIEKERDTRWRTQQMQMVEEEMMDGFGV